MSAETTDPRLAIWQYATPEERQRVIDARWEKGHLIPNGYWIVVHGHSCCPLGAALDGYDQPDEMEKRGWPCSYSVAEYLSDRTDVGTADNEAGTFMASWDGGEISRDALIAHLRRLNAQEAAK